MENKIDYPRPCGCKGCRTCLVCEKEYGIKEKLYTNHLKNFIPYTFCPLCNKIYPGWDTKNILVNHETEHQELNENGILFPGVLVHLDFITENDEEIIMKGIDEMKWDISQSGRRKQNFGPKTNFKKKKLQLGNFNGFPKFSEFVQKKLLEISLLNNYQTIEQCSLEYDPSKGASIDPHIDDCWIWGERVVTVNCLTDSVLTMNYFEQDETKYNLSFMNQYKNRLIGQINCDGKLFKDIVVRIPMPRRSLIVLYGAARYNWEHSVLREDISKRRVCIAYREFTPPYLKGGLYESEGEHILEKAKLFWDRNM